MMPFPNEETTPPVTKMYFVSATIIEVFVFLIFQRCKGKKKIPMHEKSFSDEGEKFFYPPSDFPMDIKTLFFPFSDKIL